MLAISLSVSIQLYQNHCEKVLEVGEWIDHWRAEISSGETLLDPRYGRRGSYYTEWNLRLNVDEEQLLEWRRH